MNELATRLESLHEAAFQWALHCSAGVRQDAEDGLQATYEALLDGSACFKGQSSFKSFLFAVIRNKIRSQARKKKVRRLVGLDDVRTPKVEAQGSKALEDAERRRAIRRALEELSPKQRDVLELVFYHDLTIEEAAQVMGVRLGTARTHYKRAKEGMRRELMKGGLQWKSATTGT